MLISLQIKNFRLFRDLKIDKLSRVNLIAGENNSGKTVLLEAIHLLFGADLSGLPWVFRSSQGYPDDFDSFWMWLFHRRKPNNPFKIEMTNDRSQAYRVEALVASEQLSAFSAGQPFEKLSLQYLQKGVTQARWEMWRGGAVSGHVPAAWIRSRVFSVRPSTPSEDADEFNRAAAKKGGRARLVELLRVVEPRLQDLDYLKLGNQPLVYADIGLEDLVPTTQLGQGFTRLLRLFSETIYTQSGIILIDEVESGIHYSVMGQVWKGIAAVAREQDLQVFATTHSYECIRTAHEAFSSLDTYDLTVHRLERVGEEVKVASYDRVALETSIDMNLEVR